MRVNPAAFGDSSTARDPDTNGFAHNWEIKEVKYKGKPIVGQFGQFKKDAAVVFSTLIDLYSGGTTDVDGLIKELSAHN